MKTKQKLLSLNMHCREKGTFRSILVLALVASTLQMRAADDAAAQKLMADARAKETRAHELRASAAAAMQKAADDQMEASADERDARILTAQAMKLLGADPNKQKAFKIRVEARKLTSDAHLHMVYARNAEQKAAQLSHNAEELNKAAAQIKDQPAVASTLENEAKDQAAQAQTESQTASTEKYTAQQLEERAKAAWAEAEKLDPETQRQVAATSPKPVLAQPRPVK
jgi:hypothetical protein